jgi:hypothetical protein
VTRDQQGADQRRGWLLMPLMTITVEDQDAAYATCTAGIAKGCR